LLYEPFMKARWMIGIVGLVTSAGCGAGGDNQNDGIVQASDATKQELGVTRWYTRGAPTSIEGHDDNDQVVVEARHDVAGGEAATTHKFAVRMRNQEATRTFSFAKDATGQDRVLQERFTKGFDHEHVLGLMKADIQESETSSTSLVASFKGGGALHPLSPDPNGTGQDPNGTALVLCETWLISGQVQVSETCLAQAGVFANKIGEPTPEMTDDCRNEIQTACQQQNQGSQSSQGPE
jgi:hypothetical protein